MKPVQLLTGRPGTGKTSLIRQAVVEFKGKAGGFYTEEIRSAGTRLGFRLVTFDGRESVLSHINFPVRFRVGKYGVDIEALNKVGVPALREAAARCDLIIIDEIGKMELLAPEFREAVQEIIGGGKRVLGTIMLQSDLFTDKIKSHPNVNVITLTRSNYQRVREDLLTWLRAINNTMA
jgi:nucleoside-triphosphatase